VSINDQGAASLLPPPPAPRRWGLLLPRVDADGRELFDAKRQPVYPTLTCPAGHIINWDWNIGGDCYPRCATIVGKQSECGLRIWICPLPRREKAGAPRLLVAEVDWREIQYMSGRHMDPDEIIRFLGLTWDSRAA
jgi:hypothetical protein